MSEHGEQASVARLLSDVEDLLERLRVLCATLDEADAVAPEEVGAMLKRIDAQRSTFEF